MGDRTYSFDVNLVLSDNSVTYTATGYSQANGADGVLDLGGNQFVTPLQQARMDGVLVIDVTQIDIASANETYRLSLVGSNDPNFGAGTVVELTSMQLGKGASLGITNGKDSTVGRYEQPFSSEQANVKYEYVKLQNIISGTTPSISYSAFIAVIPEP